MAYNSNKGKQHSGDVLYEGDPTDTQIDFENDSITLKTGNKERLEINDNHVSASGPVSGSKFFGDGSGLTSLSTTGVSAGDFTYTSITVNSEGRITDASNGNAPAILSYGNPGVNRIVVGTATSTTVNAASALTFDGSTLSVTGDVTASIGVSGSSLRTAKTVIDNQHFSSSLNVSASAFYGSGVGLEDASVPASAVVPAGLNTQIQFNNDGVLAGNNKLVWNGSGIQIESTSGDVFDTSNNGILLNGAGLPTHDLRMRTNTKDYALFVDSDNQYVHVLADNSSPPGGLGVDMAFFVSGAIGSIGRNKRGVAVFGGDVVVSGNLDVMGTSAQTKLVPDDDTANYNIAASDDVLVFNVTASFRARLPEITANNLGVQYHIKSVGVGAVSVTGSDGADQFIDGQIAGKVVNQGDSLHLGSFPVGAGYDWAILSFYDAS